MNRQTFLTLIFSRIKALLMDFRIASKSDSQTKKLLKPSLFLVSTRNEEHFDEAVHPELVSWQWSSFFLLFLLERTRVNKRSKKI